MKILIADDEYYTRVGLAKRIRDWDPNSIIAEAENGGQAWEMISNDAPDILFADIRMPIMDGLALVEQTHIRFPDIKTVIISGFAEFSYAKQALVSGVKDYLLKPIDREQLLNLLKNLYEDILRSDHIRNENICNRLIYEEPVDEDLAKIQVLLDKGSYYNIMVIQSDTPSCDVIERMLANMQMEALPLNIGIYSSIRFRNEKFIIIKAQSSKIDENLYKMQAEIVKLAFIKEIQKSAVKLSAGISKRTNDPDITRAYWEAKQALNSRLFDRWNDVIEYETIQIRSRYNLNPVEEISTVLLNKLIQGKDDNAKQIVSAIFEKIGKDPLYSVQCLQDAFCKLVMILNAAIEYLNQKNPGLQYPYLKQRDLSEFYYLQQIVEFLHSSINEFCPIFLSSEDKGSIVDEVEKFIKSHYFEDIMLEDIARSQYFVDPSYLSRLFKAQTGKNFSDYLLSVRMEKAKEMLETNCKLAVKDIANAVGYNDSSYFVQLFKKYYGATPGKMREILKSEA